VHNNLRLLDKIEEIGNNDDNIEWFLDDDSDKVWHSKLPPFPPPSNKPLSPHWRRGLKI